MHTLSRFKRLVSELSQLDLSVSYDRILQLENQIASSLCEHANETAVVCPSQLRHGLFTVGVLDDIDPNPSSTTANDSFHGTGISLFQFLTEFNEGIPQAALNWSTTSKSLKLPDSFITVPAVALKKRKC